MARPGKKRPNIPDADGDNGARPVKRRPKVPETGSDNDVEPEENGYECWLCDDGERWDDIEQRNRHLEDEHYRCHECEDEPNDSNTFESQQELDEHTRSHHRHCCHLCKVVKEFGKVEQLAEHFKKTHIVCRDCKRQPNKLNTFATEKGLVRHRAKQHPTRCFLCDGGPWKILRWRDYHLKNKHRRCTYCEDAADELNTFATEEELKKHCEEKHAHRCHLCDARGFKEAEDLVRHLSTRHHLCPDCEESGDTPTEHNTFATPKDVDLHRAEKHHFPCWLCKIKAWSTIDERNNHLHEKHWVCVECEDELNELNTFANEEDLEQHGLTHHSYMCWLCEDDDSGPYDEPHLLDAHIGEHHFVCTYCKPPLSGDNTFPTQGYLDEHNRHEHRHRCHLCKGEDDRPFENAEDLEAHMWNSHKVCTQCPGSLNKDNSFCTQKELDAHERKKHGHQCHLCGEKAIFRNHVVLENHYRAKHVVCNDCCSEDKLNETNTFATREQWSKHCKVKHAYKCGLCSDGGPWNEVRPYLQHLRYFHFACMENKCHQAFSSQSQLESHQEQKHGKKKPVKEPRAPTQHCSLCSAAPYADYQTLVNHFITAHFPCHNPRCTEKKGVVFRTKEELRKHEQEVHARSIPSSSDSLGGTEAPSSDLMPNTASSPDPYSDGSGVTDRPVNAKKDKTPEWAAQWLDNYQKWNDPLLEGGWRPVCYLGNGRNGAAGLWEYIGEPIPGKLESYVQKVVVKQGKKLEREANVMRLMMKTGSKHVPEIYDKVHDGTGTGFHPQTDRLRYPVQRIFIEYFPAGALEDLKIEEDGWYQGTEAQLWSIFVCLAKAIAVMEYGKETPAHAQDNLLLTPAWRPVCHHDLHSGNIFVDEFHDDSTGEHSIAARMVVGDWGGAAEEKGGSDHWQKNIYFVGDLMATLVYGRQDEGAALSDIFEHGTGISPSKTAENDFMTRCAEKGLSRELAKCILRCMARDANIQLEPFELVKMTIAGLKHAQGGTDAARAAKQADLRAHRKPVMAP